MKTSVVQFTPSIEQERILRQLLSPGQYKSAIYNAVKRTTNKARQIAAKAVLGRLTIPRKYVDDQKNRSSAIRVRVSTKTETPIGHLQVREVPIPLAAFKTVDTKVAGVQVVIDSKQAPLVLRHAFVRNLRSQKQADQGISHKAVVSRAKVDATKSAAYLQGRSRSKANTARLGNITPKGYAWRLPIEEAFGPRVVDFITKDEIRIVVERDIGNELDKQLDGQLSRFTKGRFTSIADAATALDSTDPNA